MGSRLFINLTFPGRNTMGHGLFFVLVSLGKKSGSAYYALSGFPLTISPRGFPLCCYFKHLRHHLRVFI
jgi:hypothetical protein